MTHGYTQAVTERSTNSNAAAAAVAHPSIPTANSRVRVREEDAASPAGLSADGPEAVELALWHGPLHLASWTYGVALRPSPGNRHKSVGWPGEDCHDPCASRPARQKECVSACTEGTAEPLLDSWGPRDRGGSTPASGETPGPESIAHGGTTVSKIPRT
jgi:hypothetical protein